jgi:hypothetical protein
MQPDECTPEVSWEVVWLPKLPSFEAGMANQTRISRRDQGSAIRLASAQRKAGFETKLYRIEKTEVDF